MRIIEPAHHQHRALPTDDADLIVDIASGSPDLLRRVAPRLREQ